jgi:virulence-associated protein VagC
VRHGDTIPEDEPRRRHVPAARAVAALLAVLAVTGCTGPGGLDAPLYPGLRSDEIDSITLARRDVTVSLTRSGDRWTVALPSGQGLADSTAVDDFVSVLARATRRDVIPHGSDELETLGLAGGGVGRIVVLSNGRTLVDVSVGADAPGDSRVFLRREREGDVLISPSGLGRQLQRTTDDWRDRRVMSFRLPDVTGVELVNRGRRMVLAPVDGRWRMTQPTDQEVYKGFVDGLLFSIAELDAVGFVDDGTSEACGFGEGPAGTRGSVTVRFSNGPPQSVIFGDAHAGGWCAMRPDRDDIYLVPRETVELLFGSESDEPPSR